MMYEVEELFRQYSEADQSKLTPLLRAIMKEIDGLRQEVDTAQETADTACDIGNEAQEMIERLYIATK